VTKDKQFLKFDAEGNAKIVEALQASEKKDHLRMDVSGDVQGDTLKVISTGSSLSHTFLPRWSASSLAIAGPQHPNSRSIVIIRIIARVLYLFCWRAAFQLGSIHLVR
jgi:hypothetical protein